MCVIGSFDGSISSVEVGMMSGGFGMLLGWSMLAKCFLELVV